jgi:hypothetical protein
MFYEIASVIALIMLALILKCAIEIVFKLIEIKNSVTRDRLTSVLENVDHNIREKNKERDDEVLQILRQINDKWATCSNTRL